uniref:Uncharacterized protein n=1 Tax=Rhizophora mucronata TaxID=61149 RepID=A0A2P2QD05_RHIMU
MVFSWVRQIIVVAHSRDGDHALFSLILSASFTVIFKATCLVF